MGEFRQPPELTAYIGRLRSRIDRLENIVTTIAAGGGGGGGSPTGAAGGDLTGSNYPNPVIAPLVIVNSKVSASAAIARAKLDFGSGLVDADIATGAAIAEAKLSLATDAAAGTGSRRTLGSGATQACGGTDARLSDSRAPNGSATGDLTGSYPGPTIGAGKVTRAQAATDEKAWSFLGSATGATVTVGPVVWAGTFTQYLVHYAIAGYSGGTPVGRWLCGGAAISTTALTNGSKLSEDVTAPTSAPSIPGCPLAVTLSSIARQGVIHVDGASGAFKKYEILGQNGNAAVGTPPTMYRAAGVFSDLGTNLPLQRMQLTVYDTLVAVAASTNTFTTGTYLAVWGRNTD